MANLQNSNLFTAYAQEIAGWKGEKFLNSTMLERLTMAKNGTLSVVYSPFDFVETSAKLIIVGITPGRVQAENALQSARRALGTAKNASDAVRIAKLEGSFSGALRKNLIAMLDHIGFNNYLALNSCDELFDGRSTDVHFTSALRYPVFTNGNNYNGKPDMLTTPLLLNMIDTYLQAEAEQLPEAVWLPLGPMPSAAVNHLVAKGVIDKKRVLTNMPHPSGANAERVAYFLGRKDRSALSIKTRPEPLDAARQHLAAQVSKMIEAR